MIQVSDEFKAAWLNGNEKYITLNFSDGTSLDGSSIVLESFSLTQELCTEPQFVFGLTSSAVMTVDIYNTGKKYKGLWVVPTLTAKDGDTEYSMTLGAYLIDEDVRSDDTTYRNITAYDSLKDILNTDYSEWYKGLSSMTLKQFRDAFFNHIGIEQEEYKLPHDDLMLTIKADVTGLSGADIIRDICEINAAFGFINYKDKFQYASPADRSRHFPADDLYPSDKLYPGDGADVVLSINNPEAAPFLGEFVYSDYYTHKITQAKFNYTENTPEVIGGAAGNCYEFEDNVLMYGQTESALSDIISRFIHDTAAFFYVPSRVQGRARLWIQVGDLANVITERDSALFPILSRTITGVTALYDTYEAQGTEYYSYSANSLSRKLTDSATAINNDIDEINSEIEDINEQYGELNISLQHTNEGLAAEVSRATGAESGLSSRITITENGISSEVTNRINADSSLQSQITQTADAISLKVSKADLISEINASADTITMNSGNIELSSGKLKITSGNFTLDGSGNATATNFIANNNIGVKWNANRTIYLNAIDSNTVCFSYTKGGSSNDAIIQCKRIDVDSIQVFNQTADSITTNGGIKANLGVYSEGFLTLRTGSYSSRLSGSYSSVGSQSNAIFELYNASDALSYGITYGGAWAIYVQSDERIKQNIEPISEDKYVDFYSKLKPRKFNFKSGMQPLNAAENGQWFGFIAQDVKKLAEERLINPFGFITEHTPLNDTQRMYCGNVCYQLNYENFHALHTMMIQRHEREIAELKEEIAKLKGD